jgi:hypothetical protein
MKPLKSFNLLSLLTLFLLMAGGCAHRTPIPKKIAPEAAALLDLIQQNNAKLESFRGYGQLKTTNKGKTQLFRVAWLVSRPAQCRLDILSPWGQPTATFAVDKKKLFFYIYAKDTLYEEDATAKNIARFIHVKITPEELVKVLLGSIPIMPFHQAQVRSGIEGDTLLILIGGYGNIVEKVWVRHAPLEVLQADYFNHQGSLTYRIVFDNFKHIGSITIPYVTHISGKNSRTWSLTIKKYAINIPTSQANFRLEFIRNDKIFDLSGG